MPEPAVEKHKGNQGEKLLFDAEVGSEMGQGISGRHQAINVYESVCLPSLGHLDQVNQDIQPDNGGVDHRVIL
jgi:hypothetical protein